MCSAGNKGLYCWSNWLQEPKDKDITAEINSRLWLPSMQKARHRALHYKHRSVIVGMDCYGQSIKFKSNTTTIQRYFVQTCSATKLPQRSTTGFTSNSHSLPRCFRSVHLVNSKISLWILPQSGHAPVVFPAFVPPDGVLSPSSSHLTLGHAASRYIWLRTRSPNSKWIKRSTSVFQQRGLTDK